MSLLLAGTLGAAVGALIGRWWSLGFPLVLGAAALLGFASSGSPSEDGPMVFVGILTVVATMSTALGVQWRRR